MKKNAIKKFAVEARQELISRVSQRALKYGISPKEKGNPNDDSINGYLLSPAEKAQRKALIQQIEEKGFEQVMEEVAYTWFNRFCALRFMEVNGYIPTRVRVFTDENNAFKPQILSEAMHLSLDGLEMQKVFDLKEANDNGELYKYLLITQCNALNKVLPGMFQKISDYTELLFPDNLLREGSVIQQMIESIPEEDWKEQVQIIGWLYQYYNSEKKDDVFKALKKNVKITKENIPAATQLFTPDWIVRYMVENSLGRLWVEGHPNDELKSQWKYYLEEAVQEPDVQEQLAVIKEEYKGLKPEDIRCIDPCSGSGHILAYMFDVLIQIYEAYGVDTRTAVTSIVENNIFGLDIDERATQLSYFSIMMKACQYDKRFLHRNVQPHVYTIVESNHVKKDAIDYFSNGNAELEREINTIVKELHDAKEYGSIITVTPQDWASLYSRFEEIQNDAIPNLFSADALSLKPLVQVAQALAQKYHAVITNPPYMGSSGMDPKLSNYVKNNYPDSKTDLFAVFIEVCKQMSVDYGFYAMITQHSWMFLSSFEKLRIKLLSQNLVNMAHLGPRAFEEIGGEVVQTVSFVSRNTEMGQYSGVFCRLIEANSQDGKELMFLSKENRYTSKTSNFSKIPGSPVAYWVSEKFLEIFKGKKLSYVAQIQEGLKTGNNEKFIRNWSEVNYKYTFMSGNLTAKWFYHTKGGPYRKWYGNQNEVLNYWNDGDELKNFKSASLTGKNNYLKENITYTRITSEKTCFRFTEMGSIPNMAGLAIYPNSNAKYILGWLNTKIVAKILEVTNPTLNFPPGTIANIPFLYSEDSKEEIEKIVVDNINISKTEWDSFETSWDFVTHPLIKYRNGARIVDAFSVWETKALSAFEQLKENEEELNRIFTGIYGLQDELTPEVEEKDVTVRKADLGRDIKSFISYAVGCMFGRYSLDVEGLAYAGGEWDMSKYTTFAADKDNIIPICDDEYFEDDIVGRFIKFVEVVYSKDTLQENLQFIADALGGKGQPKDVIRKYFLNEFFADHCKIYQKRPIYWLFDSGKNNGFKALIYMHRYQPDTIARIRTDYVHEQQSRYRTAIADLENRIENATTSERVKLQKQLQNSNNQAVEIHEYEEKIHHLADQMISIDLDDGVKKNYEIFKDVLAKIK